MKKLILTLDQTNWLEATWLEDEMQISCESYSGHPEHIAMLRAKALEFETSLEDYEDLIAECEKNFIAPTEEEIQAEITVNLVQEAKNYLASTDYKMTVDYFATLSEVEQNELIAKRVEAREFVRLNEGAK